MTALALHGEQYFLPLLLFAAALAAAVLLAAAWIVHWWLEGRRDAAAPPTSSLGLEDYETSEGRDLHDQRGGDAV